MSAICGIIQHNQAPVAAERCRVIQAALEPYGRHAQGLWDGQHVAIGSRLTRLLPEDQYDHQPLQGTGQRFVLVADVRLDNREELGSLLHISPAEQKTMADADILLAAYERWEQQCLEHLVGDFAFAVWDRQQRSLFLARDHLGKRPLFYHQGNGWFGFASMPAGLLALPEIPMMPDEERIRDLVLVLRDESDHSYFEGIIRLLPGHCATLQADGTFHTRRYWAPPTEERIYFKSDDDYVDAFLERLEEAVRCRLRSTGGIASQISAGFDSATVTSVAARLLAPAGQHINVYTSVPNPKGLPTSSKKLLNEGPLAAQVTALFPNLSHHQITTDDKNIFDMLELMFRLYNRPAKNVVNLLWDMSIAQLAAAQGATTLLSGELGNFTISYNGEEALNTLLREGQYNELLKQLSLQMHGASIRSRLSLLYRTLAPSLPDACQSFLEQMLRRARGNVSLGIGINPALLKDRQFQQYLQKLGRRSNMTVMKDESRLWRQKVLTRHDFAEYGKGRLALSGVDGRDPTADIRLIHYCQSIPVEQFNKNGVNRWLLRRALTRYWPQDIINSRTKGSQGADWRYKMKREIDALSKEMSYFQTQPLVQRLLDVPLLQQQLATFSTDDTLNPTLQNFKLLRFIAAGHFVRMASQKAPNV